MIVGETIEAPVIPSKYPCIESTIDLTLKNFEVRLWINQKDIPVNFAEEKKLADDITAFAGDKTLKHIIEYCATLPNVNAVQVRTYKDKKANYGVVIYTVDFQDNKG